MPDITMCLNDKCQIKNDCYRFMATPDRYQSYSFFGKDQEEKCDYFWKMKRSKEDVSDWRRSKG